MENLFLGVLCAVRRPLFNTAKSETFADQLRSQHTTLSCGKKMVNKQHIYYAGNMVYDEAKVLSYALFEEGMIKPTLSNGQTKFNYEYYLKDHLGNSRVVFKPTGTGPKIEQATEYYPFGSSFKPMDPNNDNKYLYNGKELQDDGFDTNKDGMVDVSLDWYDYGARFYDPVIGRWHSVDPLAEKYISISPYHFSGNNSILFLDLNGMDYDVYINGKYSHTVKTGEKKEEKKENNDPKEPLKYGFQTFDNDNTKQKIDPKKIEYKEDLCITIDLSFGLSEGDATNIYEDFGGKNKIVNIANKYYTAKSIIDGFRKGPVNGFIEIGKTKIPYSYVIGLLYTMAETEYMQTGTYINSMNETIYNMNMWKITNDYDYKKRSEMAESQARKALAKLQRKN